MKERDSLTHHVSVRPPLWRWVVASIVVALLAVLGGVGYYRVRVAELRVHRAQELESIARLKIRQIQEWRRGLLASLSRSVSSPAFLDLVRRWHAAPEDMGTRAELAAELELERSSHDLADVLLVDRAAHTLLSVRGDSTPSVPAAACAVELALREHGSVLSDLFRGSGGAVWLDAAAPLALDDVDGGSGVALVFRSDARTSLYPLVESWPVPSASAETLLVERDGSQVLFLNELRFRRGTALDLRLPLTHADLPAARALLGYRESWEGKDYRGVEVMAELMPVPESPWFMVAKVDRREMLRGVRSLAGGVGVGVLLLVLLGTVLTASSYRRQQASLYRTLYDAERRQREAQEEFRTTLYSIGDAVISADGSGRVRQLNAAAATLTGWSEAEAQGQPLSAVFHIIDERTRAPVEDPVARVLRERAVVRLDNHTLLVARDGTERAIADSGAPILDDQGQMLGVVLTFRDQTTERQAEARERHAVRVLEAIRSVNQLIVREKDPARLIQRACGLLVETRGYRGAWVALGPADQPPSMSAGAGVGEGGEVLHRTSVHESWPACAARARAAEEGIVTLEDSSERCDCAARPPHGDGPAAVARLTHAGEDLGVLGVALPSAVRMSAEEASLFSELAQDLAFALHAIELTASHARSEARFRLSFEHASVAKSLTLPSGRLDRVNRAFCDLLGYRRDELEALDFSTITHPDDQAATAECVRSLLAGERATYRLEKRYLRKDGGIVWADVSAVLLRDEAERPLHFVTDVLDVTERKRAQEALRLLSTRYEAVLHAVPDIIAEVDVRKVYTWLNPAGIAFFGDDAVGREAAHYFEGEQNTYGVVQPLFDGATGTTYVESWQRRRDGQRRLLAWWSRALTDGAKRVVGALSTARDITELRQLESAVAQSDRLASMGMLAAGVAHEINNPLSYVLYNLESLAQDVPRMGAVAQRCRDNLRERIGDDGLAALLGPEAEQLEPNVIKDLVERASEAFDGAQRIKDISRGLGTFSRVERADTTLVDMNRAAEHAATMAANEIRFRARLVLDLGEVPKILASEGKLAQVFLNLLVNAAHAIDEGGVDHNRITVRTWTADESVFAEVSDTGSGILPENLERVFEPFYTTKAAGRGTGLGLAIARSIVTEFDGEIQVESAVGQGATFRLRIPVHRTPPQNGENSVVARDEAATAAMVRGRVLIVDDEEGIRTTLMRLLRRDHEILTACSGIEARALLERDRDFDVILCDLMMPEMSGMELHAWLVETAPALARRVVFITGGAFTPRASEYLAQAGNPRLDKPFDTPRLRTLVSRLVVTARTRA
jgi:two-component system, cell cycle sensor histidine kinase and response regulator CckA